MNKGAHRAATGKPEAVIPSEADVCAYIAEICGELRTLAQGPRFRTVNYLLDMARLESERTGKEMRSGGIRQPVDGEN